MSDVQPRLCSCGKLAKVWTRPWGYQCWQCYESYVRNFMTINEAKQFAPIIKAYSEGKQIQMNLGDGWVDVSDPLKFDGNPCLYRVKPPLQEFYVAVSATSPFPTAVFLNRQSAEDFQKQEAQQRRIHIIVHVREVEQQ